MMPTSIQVLRDGQPLPTKEVQGDDGPITVALLDDVSAGSSGEGMIRTRGQAAHQLDAACPIPRQRPMVFVCFASCCSCGPALCASGRGGHPGSTAADGQSHSVMEERQQEVHLGWRRVQAAPCQGTAVGCSALDDICFVGLFLAGSAFSHCWGNPCLTVSVACPCRCQSRLQMSPTSGCDSRPSTQQ